MNLPILKGSDGITNSRLTCVKTCPRKHWFAYEIGLRHIDDRKPLRMGSAYHEGLDWLSKGHPLNAALADGLGVYETLPGWCKTDEDFYSWSMERETVRRMICGYAWRWSADAPLVLASELSFDLPIINPATGAASRTFRWRGKIDRIWSIADEENISKIVVGETKTTSEDIEPESDYWTRLRRDHQISGYVLAAQKLGYRVDTVLYDVIKKPTIKPKQIPLLDDQGQKQVFDPAGNRIFNKSNGKPRQTASLEDNWVIKTRPETTDEYGARVFSEMGADPDRWFARKEIPRLIGDLDEFQEELWMQAEEMRERRTKGRWFRNTSACKTFNSLCEYNDICDTWKLGSPLPLGFQIVDDVHQELV